MDRETSLVEGRQAESSGVPRSMARKLMVPPCLEELAVKQKMMVDLDQAGLLHYHVQTKDAGLSIEKNHIFGKDPSEPAALLEIVNAVRIVCQTLEVFSVLPVNGRSCQPHYSLCIARPFTVVGACFQISTVLYHQTRRGQQNLLSTLQCAHGIHDQCRKTHGAAGKGRILLEYEF